MQHTDKAREEFDAWWDRQPFNRLFEDVKDQMRNVWLASRAELVIELPEPIHGIKEFGYKAGAVRAAIEASGVTVRG